MQALRTHEEIDAAFNSGVISMAEALQLHLNAPTRQQVVKHRHRWTVSRRKPTARERIILAAREVGVGWNEIAEELAVAVTGAAQPRDQRQEELTFQVFLDPWTAITVTMEPTLEMEPSGDISQLGKAGPSPAWPDTEANHPRQKWTRESITKAAETLLMTAIHTIKDRRIAAAVRQENIEWICCYSQRGLSFDICCELVGVDGMELREQIFPLIGVAADSYDWNRMVAGGLLDDAIHVLTSRDDMSVTQEERWSTLDWLCDRGAAPKGFRNLCHRLTVNPDRLRDLLIARAWWLPE